MKDKSLNHPTSAKLFLTTTFITIMIAAIIALIVSQITHNNTIWSWIIPLGAATGSAINSGRK